MDEKKKLEIDWGDLTMAFETQSFEMNQYLDTETGKIVMVTGEADGYAEEDDEDLQDLPDWQRKEVELARLIEQEWKRFLIIQPHPSHEGYRLMERFIATVRNPRARDLLSRAIEGRGAFRRFKDTVAEFPAEEKRWYAFRDYELELDAQDWLESHGIEPTNPVKPPPELEPEAGGTEEEASLLEDLTLLVIYLSSWSEKIAGNDVRRAWKGYLFEVLDALEERDFIRSSRRAKSLTITEKGAEAARELEERLRGALES